jgi:hypothetical protein
MTCKQLMTCTFARMSWITLHAFIVAIHRAEREVVKSIRGLNLPQLLPYLTHFSLEIVSLKLTRIAGNRRMRRRNDVAVDTDYN